MILGLPDTASRCNPHSHLGLCLTVTVERLRSGIMMLSLDEVSARCLSPELTTSHCLETGERFSHLSTLTRQTSGSSLCLARWVSHTSTELRNHVRHTLGQCYHYVEPTALVIFRPIYSLGVLASLPQQPIYEKIIQGKHVFIRHDTLQSKSPGQVQSDSERLETTAML
ncbi:hypothetical protein BO99DRAFT_45754 [Aspergillus violaceofuscus CBS 115571]|uniref:Uncharacterized protein n=1 Tax=Aspergillus violaceofuscus (strain CBS 115571) TaxID=1450538 RepID=A0A2V5GX32_ASPV1|nr:hypothetical protein BO99DRAFT_45754 [Aspergillus violaceofuscus CBS 115571]